MRPKSALSPLSLAALAAGLLAMAAGPVAAEDLRLGRASAYAPASPSASQSVLLSAFPGGGWTLGLHTPTYGAVTLGVSSITSATLRTLNGTSSGPGGTRAFDLGGSYSTPLPIGRIGIFGDYGERPSILALTPATSWNFGASIGYAGFYLQGGVKESTAIGPLLGIQGMQAGFGYDAGAFDLRLSYLTSQGTAAEHEIDSKQWAIGGIYRISPRIRLNADAFYGVGDSRGSALSILPPLTSPPGTGARVGVQLRF